MLLGYKATG
jgi:hypothetical protein